MAKTLIALFASLALFVGTGIAEENPPPDGCHWQSIPELKANLSVPDGWKYEATKEGDSLVYEVTAVDPLTGAALKTQFRLVVRLHTDASDVVSKARNFVENVRDLGYPTDSTEEQSFGVMKMFVSVVELGDLTTGVPESTIAVSAIANERTGTLYTFRLDIPASELQRVSTLANKLFRTVRVDDDI